ncbi:hypothetical protein FDF11_13660 [Clostridium botulinum]|nr:hypothetical protein [Clostridium botulinum]NFR15546.1 hypothetical protein [Clostridium botulinum]NFR44858.1 hypothetical protein [Clostridium botulinum]NFS51682.1 hypothetical protein [Clostridium botulinum]
MSNMDNEKIYYQEKNQLYIKNNLGNEMMVPVYAKEIKNGYDSLYWSALISIDIRKSVLEKTDWDLSIGEGTPGFTVYGNDVDGIYSRFNGLDGIEPIVYPRNFHGLREDYVEIIEEFKLLNNLYYDKQKDEYISLEDGEETVIRIENKTNVYIKLKYLKKFLAVKNMDLAIYFDIQFNEIGTLKDIGLKQDTVYYVDDSINYDVYIGEYNVTGETNRMSRINGKKLITGIPLQECGYWPYDKQAKYEKFIIGTNKNGEEIEFECNPEMLNNYFDSNPQSPHYLTPVFFTKDVLNKYYSKPEIYSVEDSILKCGALWSLYIDNQDKNYVSAYLGDLGRSLSYKEQLYWKSFNVACDEKISETKFKRDFMAQFADPEAIDLIFKQKFNAFCKKWNKKYKWDLFLPLSEKDQYNFEHIRIPINNSISELDTLTLSLVKAIIDSLNEKEIEKNLKLQYDNLKGSITKLEKWLIEINVKEYQEHIKFLRDLQELRSSSSGHRKGKNYKKISKKFEIGSKSYADVFEEILENVIRFLDFMEECFLI